MCHEELGGGGEGDLCNHVVLWVLDEGPPEKEERLMDGDRAEIVNDRCYFRGCENQAAAECRVFVLKNEWDGQHEVEKPQADELKLSKRGSTSGAQARDEDVGVENDPGDRHPFSGGRKREPNATEAEPSAATACRTALA